MINWQVRTEDYGKYNIKFRISDDKGAEALYPLSIDIGKLPGK